MTPHSPVLVTPGVRLVERGISTDVSWERDEAGEHVAEIAATFDLTPEDVCKPGRPAHDGGEHVLGVIWRSARSREDDLR